MNIREKWLLSILTGIFIIQASVLVWGIKICSEVIPRTEINDVCPELGERFDLTFGTMIATTLALLTGSTLASQRKKEKDAPPPYIPPKPGRQ